MQTLGCGISVHVPFGQNIRIQIVKPDRQVLRLAVGVVVVDLKRADGALGVVQHSRVGMAFVLHGEFLYLWSQVGRETASKRRAAMLRTCVAGLSLLFLSACVEPTSAPPPVNAAPLPQAGAPVSAAQAMRNYNAARIRLEPVAERT